MENTPQQNTPDELKIKELLSSFKPHPSQRFYRMMGTAPWQQQDLSQTLKDTRQWKLSLKSAWGFATMLLVGAVIILAVFPSARVAASQIIHFFLPSATDEIDVNVTVANPNDMLDFANPSNFKLTIYDVQQKAGFVVRQIPSSLDAPPLIGARYNPGYNAVTLLYKAEDYILLLTQRQLGNSQDVFSIGANAHVELVNLEFVQAEYVMGGWKAVSTQPVSGTQAAQSMLQIRAIWDNNLPQSTLRWQDSGFAYELRINGNNGPSRSELITWANGLK